MKKSYLILIVFLLISFLNYPKVALSIEDFCQSPCICGNDSDADGFLNEREFDDMVGGNEEMPSFGDIDDDKNGLIDEAEIRDYPGCE